MDINSGKTKKSIQYDELGFKQLTLISILIAGVSITVLLDNIPLYKKRLNIKISTIGHFSLFMMFIVFCIHVLISGVLSIHMYIVYKLLSITGNSKKVVIASRKLHPIIDKLLQLFWISLPIFILSSGILTILRYDIFGESFMYLYITAILLFIFYFVYFIRKHIKMSNKIVQEEK